MRIETFEGKDGWRWRLRADNGEILSTSEAYYNKSGAEETARTVQQAFTAGGSMELTEVQQDLNT